MKKFIGIPILALVVLLPAGLAFADKCDSNNDQKPLLGGVMSSTSLNIQADPWMNGEKNGLRDHFGLQLLRDICTSMLQVLRCLPQPMPKRVKIMGSFPSNLSGIGLSDFQLRRQSGIFVLK
jgi:hypothetical protein